MRLASLTLAASILAIQPGHAGAAGFSVNPAAAPAGHYVLDPQHASIVARVRHMGLSSYTLRFDRIEASYNYDPAHPTASKIVVAVDAHSLDNGDAAVSRQFAQEFLAADENPRITFTSTALQAGQGVHGTVAGDLTLRGVTRPVILEVTFNGVAAYPVGAPRMGFSATTVIKRSEFGSHTWQGVVGDDVQLTIEAEFARQ